MTLLFREACDEDRGTIRNLLEVSGLPTETLDGGSTTFYIAEEGENIVGIAGIEFYGDDALLRSVAVEPVSQRRGLGSEIVDFMLDLARQKKVRNIVLMTETAEDFFARKRFQVIDRSSVSNEQLKQSSEFTFACPTSAVCMMLRLW